MPLMNSSFGKVKDLATCSGSSMVSSRWAPIILREGGFVAVVERGRCLLQAVVTDRVYLQAPRR